ncbi:hypothetical protein LIER_09564 [Lithospermum erythrorhizon]|uniref:Uncharacterized protein n=1 Tax=Lithospermum erythrorhizon TaxID=34254 RepID=A0AAV3PG46_LITER
MVVVYVENCLLNLFNCLFHRLHALAALAGAAVVEYYDHSSGAKAQRVAAILLACLLTNLLVDMPTACSSTWMSIIIKSSGCIILSRGHADQLNFEIHP